MRRSLLQDLVGAMSGSAAPRADVTCGFPPVTRPVAPPTSTATLWTRRLGCAADRAPRTCTGDAIRVGRPPCRAPARRQNRRLSVASPRRRVLLSWGRPEPGATSFGSARRVRKVNIPAAPGASRLEVKGRQGGSGTAKACAALAPCLVCLRENVLLLQVELGIIRCLLRSWLACRVPGPTSRFQAPA